MAMTSTETGRNVELVCDECRRVVDTLLRSPVYVQLDDGTYRRRWLCEKCYEKARHGV